MLARLIVCVAALGLGLRPCTAQSTSTPPQASPGVSVLDAYKEIWSKVRGDKLILTAYIYPDRTRLELDPSAPPNAKKDLVNWLKEIQPQVQRIIELSKKDPGAFPPDPEMDPAKPDAHMEHPRAWMQNFTRILRADAVRHWEAGDAPRAAERLAAILRIGTSMQSQQSELVQITGLGILGSCLRQCTKLADAGLVSKLKPAAAADLRGVVAKVRTRKRTGSESDLSGIVERELKSLREKLGK